MYSITSLRLPPETSLVLRSARSGLSIQSLLMGTERALESVTRNINLKFDEDKLSSGVYLLSFVLGEKISFRKSVTGLKIVKGEPDFSGNVSYTNLIKPIAEIVESRRNRAKSMRGRDSIFSRAIRASNLCQEEYLPTAGEIDWRSLTTAQTTGTTTNARSPGAQSMADIYRSLMDTSHYEEIARLMSSTALDRSLYYTRNTTRNAMSNRLLSADFDGDVPDFFRTVRPDSTASQTEPAPRYAENTNESVAQVDLVNAITAAMEITQGERGRPPASRGPRPRNQRW